MLFHIHTIINTDTHDSFKSRGFTLIEVMVAMAIFTILVTIGIGSVLNAMQQHQTIQNVSSVMDNLNFVMEDMTHNIRLGTNIHCLYSGEVMSFATDTDVVVSRSCPLPTDAHNSIVFNNQEGNLVTYLISTGIGGTPSQIYKQKGYDSSTMQLVSPASVTMDYARSGFTVYGAEAGTAGDHAQPTVVIRLSGKITYKGVDSNFSIETTVTPRSLDS